MLFDTRPQIWSQLVSPVVRSRDGAECQKTQYIHTVPPLLPVSSEPWPECLCTSLSFGYAISRQRPSGHGLRRATGRYTSRIIHAYIHNSFQRADRIQPQDVPNTTPCFHTWKMDFVCRKTKLRTEYRLCPSRHDAQPTALSLPRYKSGRLPGYLFFGSVEPRATCQTTIHILQCYKPLHLAKRFANILILEGNHKSYGKHLHLRTLRKRPGLCE